ncbi:MAG: type IIA DNA topoisomerase subunit B [Candidatus Aureabacteria bacterium]|nr:type IIA DNA topoisomerase subunit B [Candidatus Auribacterota bacterium]
MADKKSHQYDESKIKTLSSLEHIRTRSSMYIGRLGDGSNPNDGIYILLKEVVDNSVDEYIMGYGNKIDIEIRDKKVIVRDYGRGIPLGKVVDCVSRINTGAKYNDDVFQFSVGLNGVGTKAVNALSENFKVTSFREGRFKSAEFKSGILKKEDKGLSNKTPEGTLIEFIPDKTIFNDYEFRDEFVRKRLQHYAYLNKSLKLIWNGEEIISRNGLKDLLQSEIQEENLYDIMYYSSSTIEFAFTHSLNYGETFFSFVNGQYTQDGGTHLSSFKEGILKGVNEFANKNFLGNDVREGMIGAIAIKLKEPVFESQTKNKLGNTDIRGWIVSYVKDAVVDFLHKNKNTASRLLEKISLNEKVRMELQNVRKDAKEKAKKIAIKIPNLKDSKHHFNDGSRLAEETMIFLTEGQSASGSMVSSRNVLTQAIFSLKGKPLNCLGMKKDSIYQNDELYNIMQSLNIENDIENLRYAKVILATDADVDGLHIRNLLLTFFIHYFEPLVVGGHLHILETPLFRVRTAKETRYCYSEAEKNQARKDLGVKCEITRFKGLGEISPNEFGQFIGEKMRLIPVVLDQLHDVHKKMEFYMGKNTPERKEYIMNHLIPLN